MLLFYLFGQAPRLSIIYTYSQRIFLCLTPELLPSMLP